MLKEWRLSQGIPRRLTTAGNCQPARLGRLHQQQETPMSVLDFVNLYVADAEKSAGLYNEAARHEAGERVARASPCTSCPTG